MEDHALRSPNPPRSVHPDILHIALRQLLILPILRLPHREPSIQHINLLTLALLRSKQPLAFSSISQRSTRSTLLAQRTVEDDFVLVFEGADQFGSSDVELGAGNPEGGSDVAADMIWLSQSGKNWTVQ